MWQYSASYGVHTFDNCFRPNIRSSKSVKYVLINNGKELKSKYVSLAYFQKKAKLVKQNKLAT